MATASGLGKSGDLQSGGKIVTRRHKRPKTTPYDRPPASLQQPPKNRNWISDVILPATRIITSGAAKIISSVFDSDDSSSLSSSDSVPASEYDMNNDNYYEDSEGFNYLNEDQRTTSVTVQSFSKEPQLSFQRSDANHVEQLLLSDKFTRQEYDKFIQIIKSRIPASNLKGGEVDVPTNVNLSGNVGDVCSKAVLEARKWLEEKQVGQSPSSHMADGSDCSLNQIQNEVGSPSDVAKAYMKSRPPWASPSAEYVGLDSPLKSPILRGLLSADEESQSSFRKQSSLASGSWNIQEEIRKVRSKATEDLLHSSPITKVDLSSFALSAYRDQDTLSTNLSMRSREYESKKLTPKNTEPLDQSRNIARIECSDNRISSLETIPNLARNESLKAIPTTATSEQSPDLLGIKVPDQCTSSESNHASPDRSKEHGDAPCSIHLKDSSVVEVNGTQKFNGLTTSEDALSVEMGIQEIQSQSIDKEVNDFKDDQTVANMTPLEDKCELLSEASVEVPIVRGNNVFDNSSHGSGMGDEELSRPPSQTCSVKMVGQGEGKPLKPEEKRTGRYTRRSKIRGE